MQCSSERNIRRGHLQDILLIEKKQDVDGICFFLSKKGERSVFESLLVFKKTYSGMISQKQTEWSFQGRDREEQAGMEPDFTEHLVFRICLWSLITIYYGRKTKLNGNSAKGKEIDLSLIHI